MAYVAISSDLHGNLFAIDHAGDLWRNHHVARDRGPLAYPGLGKRIGSGWRAIRHFGVSHVGGRLLVIGVTPSGDVMKASTALENVDEWANVVPTADITPLSWNALAIMCAGADGEFFGVTAGGVLQRRAYQVTTGPTGVPVLTPAMDTLATGWDAGPARLALFTNGNRFFDVTVEGTLRYQDKRINPDEATNEGWVVLASGWTAYQRVLAASATSLYAIGSEGSVHLHGFTEDANQLRIIPRAAPHAIGSGVVGWATLPCAVEGYATPQSVLPGDTVNFHVAARNDGSSLAAPCMYNVEFVRLPRTQDGKVGRSDECVASMDTAFMSSQIPLAQDWLEFGAQYPVSFQFVVPTGLPSGLYAARCTDASDASFYIPFVVRSSMRAAPFAVICNTNTWNAYNSWGGYGKYVHRCPLPHYIPFERPHPGLTPDIPDKYPNPELFNQSNHLLRAELWFLGWMDGLGSEYQYDLYTDRDLHDGIASLMPKGDKRYAALILTVHPEYWTAQMYDCAKAYQDTGGSILYLGGNGIYEEVRFQASGVGLSIFPGVDWNEIGKHATNEVVRLQCLWRLRGRPERALIGVGFEQYSGPTVDGQPFQFAVSSGMNPALKGLLRRAGDHFGQKSANPGFAANGWEVDQRGRFSPDAAYEDHALLAIGACSGMSGEMLFYETPAGGFVFAGSSLSFCGSLAVDSTLQRILTNVLQIALNRPDLP